MGAAGKGKASAPTGLGRGLSHPAGLSVGHLPATTSATFQRAAPHTAVVSAAQSQRPKTIGLDAELEDLLSMTGDAVVRGSAGAAHGHHHATSEHAYSGRGASSSEAAPSHHMTASGGLGVHSFSVGRGSSSNSLFSTAFASGAAGTAAAAAAVAPASASYSSWESGNPGSHSARSVSSSGSVYSSGFGGPGGGGVAAGGSVGGGGGSMSKCSQVYVGASSESATAAAGGGGGGGGSLSLGSKR